MSQLTKSQRHDIRVERNSRKIVIKKLDSSIRELDRRISHILADRQARRDQLSEFNSESDIQDAYGWGFISEEEYYSILDSYRAGLDSIDSELSAEECARSILLEFRSRMNSDIADLSFQLLPPNEQARILEDNFKISQRRLERKKLLDSRNI